MSVYERERMLLFIFKIAKILKKRKKENHIFSFFLL